GNGSTCKARSLASGDRILIKIQPKWHRSMAKNMPLIAGRIGPTRSWSSRSATCSLLAIHTDLQNPRELPDRQVFDIRFAACCGGLSLLMNSPRFKILVAGFGAFIVPGSRRWRPGGDFDLSQPAPIVRLDKKPNIYQ